MCHQCHDPEIIADDNDDRRDYLDPDDTNNFWDDLDVILASSDEYGNRTEFWSNLAQILDEVYDSSPELGHRLRRLLQDNITCAPDLANNDPSQNLAPAVVGSGALNDHTFNAVHNHDNSDEDASARVNDIVSNLLSLLDDGMAETIEAETLHDIIDILNSYVGLARSVDDEDAHMIDHDDLIESYVNTYGESDADTPADRNDDGLHNVAPVWEPSYDSDVSPLDTRDHPDGQQSLGYRSLFPNGWEWDSDVDYDLEGCMYNAPTHMPGFCPGCNPAFDYPDYVISDTGPAHMAHLFPTVPSYMFPWEFCYGGIKGVVDFDTGEPVDVTGVNPDCDCRHCRKIRAES